MNLLSLKPERELSIDQVLFLTFKIFRDNFLFFYLTMLLSQLVITAALTILYLRLQVLPEISPNAPPEEVLFWFEQHGSPFLQVLLFVGLVYLVVRALVDGLLVTFVADILEGRKVDFAAALSHSATRFLPMMVTLLVTYILTAAGLFLLIIPGVFLALMLSLSFQVVMLEGKSAITALKRSRTILHKKLLKTLGLSIQVSLFIVLAGLLTDLILSFIILPGIVNDFLYSALMALVFPLSIISQTVYYYTIFAREKAMSVQNR